jgi:HlyD family secretion protein
MKILNTLFSWYGKKRVLTVLLIVVVLMAWGLMSKSKDGTESLTNENINKYPVVKVTTASQINNSDQLSLVGKVRALSEVDITPDRSGRVTKVNTTLGESVHVGQVIVELENASERASLLQAEGAYENALANSAQSGVGLREAEHDLDDSIQNTKNIGQNSYNAINNVILSTVDLFFSNPDSTIPGLKIGGVGNTDFLNNERVAFQTILPNWNKSLMESRDLNSELENIQVYRTYSKRTLDLINTLIPLLNNDRSVGGYSESEITNLRQQLITAQTQTTNVIGDLDSAYTKLKNSKENLERAKISATGSDSSLSDAQIKQALGTLRSAQANFEKTILRSPINGTVNEMNVKVGEFLSASKPIAKIANNTKSEIVVYVSDKEKENINVGDEVMINDKTKGQIAIIAPAIDSATQKTEVRIVSEDDTLVIGDTVRVTGQINQSSSSTTKINIPLTAVKFDNTQGYVFLVENETLIKKDVQVGEVRGAFVDIVSGLDNYTEFVIDARGHSSGEKVEILR